MFIKWNRVRRSLRLPPLRPSSQVNVLPWRLAALTWFMTDVVFGSTLGLHVAQIHLLVDDLNLQKKKQTVSEPTDHLVSVGQPRSSPCVHGRGRTLFVSTFNLNHLLSGNIHTQEACSGSRGPVGGVRHLRASVTVS